MNLSNFDKKLAHRGTQIKTDATSHHVNYIYGEEEEINHEK